MSMRSTSTSIVLHGRRINLRTLVEADYSGWFEVRSRCRDWLLKWEPRAATGAHLPDDRRSFAHRCGVRDRERELGSGFGFTTGVGGLTGEKAGGISAIAGTGNAPGLSADAMASGGGGGSRSLVVTGLAPSRTIGSGMPDGLVA